MKNRIQDIKRIKFFLTIIIVFCCFLEVVRYFTFISVLFASSTLFSLYLFNKFIFTKDNIVNYSLSFFTILVPSLFMLLPIPVTLLEGRSAYDYLKIPNITIPLQFIYYVVIVISFVLAKSPKRGISKLTRRLDNLGVFPQPNVKMLWIMGFLGCIPRILILIVKFDVGVGLLSTLSYFMYSPFLIPFSVLFTKEKRISNKQYIYILLYLLGVSLLMIGTNARHYLLTPYLTIFMCFVVKYFYCIQKKSVLEVKKVFIIVLLLSIIYKPASDLANAMVMTRDIRRSVSFTELISETFKNYENTKELNEFISRSTSLKDITLFEWDETYTSNVFLNRFCNYRVVDLSIYHANNVGYWNAEMLKKLLFDLLALPPTPIPQLLFNIDKSDKNSPMDILYNISSHVPLTGGLRVGGDVGLGLSYFGFFYYIVQLIVYTMIFRIFNSLAFMYNGRVVISYFVLIQMMDLAYSFMVHNGIGKHIGLVVWGIWWNLFILTVVYKIVLFLVIKTEKKSL